MPRRYQGIARSFSLIGANLQSLHFFCEGVGIRQGFVLKGVRRRFRYSLEVPVNPVFQVRKTLFIRPQIERVG